MTTAKKEKQEVCPAQEALKVLSGKWKPEIFRLALNGPVRFSSLLRCLEGSNKQGIATALKELEEKGLLKKNIIRLKPLHIEYVLSEKGEKVVPVFRQMENIS